MSLQSERLYYSDSYLKHFTSVVEQVKEKDGETFVRLRESAFYPTSGGQPYDTGTITVSDEHRSYAVTGVEVEDGAVWHRISAQTAAPAADSPQDQAHPLAPQAQLPQTPPLAPEAPLPEAPLPEAPAAQIPPPGQPSPPPTSPPAAAPGSLHVGQVVTGTIDWARRFDFMQQHSGQHILSACFDQMLGAATTSFHMGDTYSTIDLALPSLSDPDVGAVMIEANRWVWRDVPIRARFVSQQELASMALRKAPSVSEDIRIVTIEGLEDNACGGTHPSSTGQVGQILITRIERMKGGVRVTFGSGARSLNMAKEAVDMVRQMANGLSVGTADLPGTVESLLSQVKEGNRRYEALRGQYANLLAREYATENTQTIGNTHVLVAVLPDLDEVQELKRMAASASEWLTTMHPGEPQLIVFAGHLGARVHLVAQATEGAVFGADAVIKAVLPGLDGKGGGNAKAAQGSAPASVEEVRAAVESYVNSSQRTS